MNKKITKDWFIAAGIRALRTSAQTALGLFTVGMTANEVNWMHILSVALVAGVYSLLTSIVTTLPEVPEGNLIINTSAEKDIYRLETNGPVEDLAKKKTVLFKVQK